MQTLIGRKVNLVQEKLILGNGKEYIQYKLDDPSFVETVHGMYPDVRIFPPGTCGTADWVPTRANVYINSDGIVTEVNYG